MPSYLSFAYKCQLCQSAKSDWTERKVIYLAALALQRRWPQKDPWKDLQQLS